MKRLTTFDQLLDQYLLERPLSEASKASYQRILRCFIRDTGIEKLDDLSFQTLLQWRMDVITRSSDITWNTYLRHMRALWRFALKRGYSDIHEDLFMDLNWGKYKLSRKRKTLSADQIKAIISLLSEPSCPLEPCWFWKLLIRFIYHTGVRRKQIIEIRWRDIDLKRKTLYLSAESEKTDRDREIPIHKALIKGLREYKLLMENYYPASLKPEAQVFNVTIFYDRYHGKIMTEEQLSGFFRRLGDAVGFKVSAHMLRHTMATEIAKTGQIKSLQQILGHSSLHTTMSFYVHPDIKQLRKTLENLEGI